MTRIKQKNTLFKIKLKRTALLLGEHINKIQHGHYQQHSELKDSAYALVKISYGFERHKNTVFCTKKVELVLMTI